ncbi:hypothetical protein PBT90_02860 [Algoriphagus halophytocola]|uniref:hypothetical protein n=1 Tax=Algoriphagus halophytocola TaxID=2991499 RepID=UPI0022DE5E23|nr:hypothetical protein [Algoriphagus sp. TR-M9]WBL43629.1 hypothetical protein PBT90_02860 [Algoriphagus sp. TR-M9]
MSTQVSPVFHLFEKQHLEAKALFLALGKQIKSKKAIELSEKMDFLELYAELMAKVHYDKEGMQFEILSDFKKLQRSLKKVLHIKLAERNLDERELKTGVKYNSYRLHLDKYKKQLYTQTFDLVVGSTLKSWEELYQKTKSASKGITPLTINTSVSKLIQEELEFIQIDLKQNMESKVFKEVFEGLRTIIMLENLLIYLGFNPIFVESIHREIHQLKENLKPWYSNHLALQSLMHFISGKENLSKKYQELAKTLRADKKALSADVGKQAHALFDKILV